MSTHRRHKNKKKKSSSEKEKHKISKSKNKVSKNNVDDLPCEPEKDTSITDDYCDVDQPLPRQDYFVMSFAVMPEEMKEKYINDIAYKFRVKKSLVKNVVEAWCKEEHPKRSLKFRGAVRTQKEAKSLAQRLQKRDRYYHIFSGPSGYWVPFGQAAESAEEEIYAEEQLQKLHRGIKENQVRTQEHYEEVKHNKIRKAMQEAKERKKQLELEKQLSEVNVNDEKTEEHDDEDDDEEMGMGTETGKEKEKEKETGNINLPLPAMEALLQQYRDNMRFTENALKEYNERLSKLKILEGKLCTKFAEECMNNPDYIPGMIKPENNPMLPIAREEIASTQVTPGEIGQHEEPEIENIDLVPHHHVGQHNGENSLPLTQH